MKKCTECGIERPISDYHKKAGKLRANCRYCVSEYTKSHYKNNTAYYIEKAKINRKKAQARLRAYLFNYKAMHPCVDCGEVDPIVLEFDHLANKSDGLARMATRALSLDKIIDEIAKCEVVCANCHKRRTSRRLNWYNKQL